MVDVGDKATIDNRVYVFTDEGWIPEKQTDTINDELRQAIDTMESSGIVKLAVDSMIDASHSIALSKGWWDEGGSKSFGEQIALMISELIEALEEYRNGHEIHEIYFVTDADGNEKPEGVPIELMDCIIRILDTAGYYSADLFIAWVLKTKYNLNRPYRHGGKVI